MKLPGAPHNQVPPNADGAGKSGTVMLSEYRVGRGKRERVVEQFMGWVERRGSGGEGVENEANVNGLLAS